jgi:hypothetical protein
VNGLATPGLHSASMALIISQWRRDEPRPEGRMRRAVGIPGSPEAEGD